MESSHSEPPEPKPPDKVPTPSTSPPRKSRSRERTVKNQYDTNKSEQTKCAQLVSTAERRKPIENPEVVVKRILSKGNNPNNSNNSSRNSSCSSTDKRKRYSKRESAHSTHIPIKQKNSSGKSVKTVNTLTGVRVKDTDSDSVSLTDKYTSSEDLSFGDVTITDATNIDVTDVTYDPAMSTEGNMISSPESPQSKKPKMDDDSLEGSGEISNPTGKLQVQRSVRMEAQYAPKDASGEDIFGNPLEVKEKEDNLENKDNLKQSAEVSSIGGDTEAETTEPKVLELPLTAEASNTLNDEHEAPSTELDVSNADDSKVWASEVDEAPSESFGKHESPSFLPKAGDIDEAQVDISGFYDTDHESLESKQTLDESEESEADPAGNSRGAEIGRRPRADAPQEEEPAVGDNRSGRRPRARSISESRKSSDFNSKGNSKGNSTSDPEFTAEDMQKNRERIASTVTPFFHRPGYEFNANARNTRKVDGADLQTPEGPYSKTAGENTKVVNKGVPRELDHSPPSENGKCGERPTIIEYEQQQYKPTDEKTEIQGKCSENQNPLETPIEPTKTEKVISGKCGEKPTILQKTFGITTESIIQEIQRNVPPITLGESQAMLVVKQQKEKIQTQAEIDKLTAYVSEYQAETNKDQIIEPMDCQTVPYTIIVEAQVHQEQNHIEEEKQVKPSPKPVVRGLPDSDIPLTEPWKEFVDLYMEADKKAIERNRALTEKRAREDELKRERKLSRRKSTENGEPNIERTILNVQNKKGTKILQTQPMTPEISDGEIMIEEKAKSSMATSYKNREMENNTSETDNYYQKNEEKLNELMNKMREEITQHAEIHLNHIAAFNDEIEETNKNIIRDMCREGIYELYEKHYTEKYKAEIQTLTERLERYTKHPKSLRKNKKVGLNAPGQGSRELDLGEKQFPHLRQQVKVSKESNTPSKKSRQTQTTVNYIHYQNYHNS
ncbi:hypothetical protein JTB14_024097 [Gonioctena quinquepunctata]|nr:hypothetical protein JTB14_024097 [Gonioctena quinquepunctata]